MDEKLKITNWVELEREYYELDQKHDSFFSPLGKVTIETSNGLVTSKHEIEFNEYDLNDDDSLNQSFVNNKIMKFVSFDIHHEVKNCIHRLAQLGWISADYVCEKYSEKQSDSAAILEVRDWYCGPLLSDYLNIYPPLGDISEFSFSEALRGPLLDAIVREEEAYSEEWYCVKICEIYFNALDTDINKIALLGKLVEQLEWKFSHEDKAIAQVENPKKARETKSEIVKKKKEMIVKLAIDQFKKEKTFGGAKISEKARVLLARAYDEHPNLFGRKGEGKTSQRAVKGYIEDETHIINRELSKFYGKNVRF